MTTRTIEIRNQDYMDWSNAINPTDNEEIQASKDHDGKVTIQFTVKNVKEYLNKVKFNLKETKSYMALKYGEEW